MVDTNTNAAIEEARADESRHARTVTDCEQEKNAAESNVAIAVKEDADARREFEAASRENEDAQTTDTIERCDRAERDAKSKRALLAGAQRKAEQARRNLEAARKIFPEAQTKRKLVENDHRRAPSTVLARRVSTVDTLARAALDLVAGAMLIAVDARALYDDHAEHTQLGGRNNVRSNTHDFATWGTLLAKIVERDASKASVFVEFMKNLDWTPQPGPEMHFAVVDVRWPTSYQYNSPLTAVEQLLSKLATATPASDDALAEAHRRLDAVTRHESFRGALDELHPAEAAKAAMRDRELAERSSRAKAEYQKSVKLDPRIGKPHESFDPNYGKPGSNYKRVTRSRTGDEG